jgi:hypothetical protein
MRESDIDRIERQAVLENDRKVFEQRRGSTFHQHALAQADEINRGRFAAVGTPHVVGSTPIPKYPELPASSPFYHDPVPNEPPLSVHDNPALENPADAPLVSASAVTGGAEAPSVQPPGFDVEHAAPP